MQNEMQRWRFASAGQLQGDWLQRASGLILLMSDLPSAAGVLWPKTFLSSFGWQILPRLRFRFLAVKVFHPHLVVTP